MYIYYYELITFLQLVTISNTPFCILRGCPCKTQAMVGTWQKISHFFFTEFKLDSYMIFKIDISFLLP